MSIAGRNPRKSTRKPAKPAPKKRSSQSAYRRKKPNGFLRFLSRFPSWVLWLFGTLIALCYVFFILQVVLHFSMPWRAMYGDVPEPDGYGVRGVDISHYQTNINWTDLRDGRLQGHPVRFVIIKATEGAAIFDNHFNDNFHKAHRYGFIRGAYHFYIPATDAAAQARFFLSQAHLMPGDLPPVLDVEKSGGLSVTELQKGVREWLRIVGNHYGTKPIIYTNYAFKLKYLNTPEFDAYPFWIAHYYKDELDYKGDWVMWQYTDCGHVAGIDGNVDCNVFNGSLDKLIGLCITEEQYPVGD